MSSDALQNGLPISAPAQKQERRLVKQAMTQLPRHSSLEPRLSSLETSVASLSDSIAHVTSSLDSLRSAVVDRDKPQWGNLISLVSVGVVIVTAIGSAWIAPITVTIRHHDMVLAERRAMIDDLQERLRITESLASTNKRVFEGEINNLRADLLDVRNVGAPITRERLAVIESELKRIGKESGP